MPTTLPQVAVVPPHCEDWRPYDLVRDVTEMRDAARAAGREGPFVLYHGTGWSARMADRFLPGKKTTLLQKLLATSDIEGVGPDERLGEYDLLLVRVERAAEGKA